MGKSDPDKMTGWTPVSGYPEAYIIRVAQHYQRTGNFPDGKPLNEQDALLYQDILDFMALIAREEWELSKDERGSGEDWIWEDETDIDAEASPAIEGLTPLPLFGSELQ